MKDSGYKKINQQKLFRSIETNISTYQSMPWEGYMVLSASTVESFLSLNRPGVAFSFQTNVYNIVCWDVCAVSQAACTTSYDHIVAAVFNTYLCLLKETVLEVGERKIQTRERVPDNSRSHFPEIMTITLLCDWIFLFASFNSYLHKREW